MTRRQQRRFKQMFDRQVEQERNGKPVDPEIAALMTKPITEQTLFQVVVTERESKRLVTIGPKMGKPYTEALAETINKAVLAGQERVWSNAAVVPMTLIAQGA